MFRSKSGYRISGARYDAALERLLPLFMLVERTDVLVHEAIYDLMLRAAGDIHVFQQTQAAAARANQTSGR